MNKEEIQCQNCKQDFVSTDNDQKFYERLNSPLPLYCPPCRMQRRLAHRNERTLYKIICDLCKKNTISIYPAGAPWPVYCASCWWSDNWDAKSFALDYKPDVPFFEQFKELQNRVPRIALLSITSVNSEYTNNAEDNKNCYLMFAAGNNEDCLYGRLVYDCKSVVDTCFVYKSELCYECIDCRQCYNCMFSQRCQTSVDLLLCFNVRDSQNCILCTNIRHKTYCIENIQYAKKEYEKKKKEVLASYESIEAAKKRFEKLKSKALVKYAFQTKCVNATGDYLYNCHDARLMFDASNAKNCAYMADVEDPIDCLDGNNMYYKPELCLDLMGVLQCYGSKHSSYVLYCSSIEYCDNCQNLDNCFGCIGLRKSKYCILNKEYGEEEYLRLKDQIVSSMEKEEIYGQFLSPALSPFGYNETLAKDYFPLLKEEALQKGFKWQDKPTGTYRKETIPKGNMPSTVEEIPDAILKEILVCIECGKNFRITPAELDFYKRMHLPLPRKDFECRHQERMQKRTPRKLWHRACQCAGRKSEARNPRLRHSFAKGYGSAQQGFGGQAKSETIVYENTTSHSHGNKPCLNEFETSYAPERPEIVYCEQCYNAEIV